MTCRFDSALPGLRRVVMVLLAGSVTHALPVSAGDWGVNVYGLSYHWDRDAAKRHKADNEFNPGLGVRYGLGNWLKAEAFLDGGVYRDSGRNTAIYGGAGLLWPLDDAKRFNLGAALVAFHSETYNKGDAFVAPVPLFALRFDKAIVNLTHFPAVEDYNRVSTTAMFVTIPLK